MGLRERIYYLLREGCSQANAAKIIGTSPAIVCKHSKYLEEHHYLERVPGTKSPILYDEGKRSFEGVNGHGNNHGHGGWWNRPLEVHNDSRKFKVNGPPTRPFDWDRSWESSGVRFSHLKPFEGEDKRGPLRAASVRYVEGPKNRTLVVYLAPQELVGASNLEAYFETADGIAQRIGNWMSKHSGMKLGLMEPCSIAHYCRILPPGVGRMVKQHGNTDGNNHGRLYVDESKGEGIYEAETQDERTARYLVDLPDIIEDLQDRVEKLEHGGDTGP